VGLGEEHDPGDPATLLRGHDGLADAREAELGGQRAQGVGEQPNVRKARGVAAGGAGDPVQAEQGDSGRAGGDEGRA
jgi:hypothetical protein